MLRIYIDHSVFSYFILWRTKHRESEKNERIYSNFRQLKCNMELQIVYFFPTKHKTQIPIFHLAGLKPVVSVVCSDISWLHFCEMWGLKIERYLRIILIWQESLRSSGLIPLFPWWGKEEGLEVRTCLK